MGIRYLTSFLRPFVDSEPLEGKSVVIDASALAHHLFHISIGRRSRAASAFEAIPTYLELSEATIGWLNQLKQSGVTIERIYFDGFLPPSKFPTRLERFVEHTNRLLKYYQSHLGPCKAPIPASEDPKWLFNSKPIATKLTCIPPLSFLVPAVIEALLSSEYAGITEVVPDEADLYCAKYAYQFGCTVLTGDSDLLVHNLGPNGNVCFLKDLELTSKGDGEEIRSLTYHPMTIASRLGLTKEYGLRSLAFEISMDPDGSFGKLHMQAKNLEAIRAYPQGFRDFLEPYSELPKDLDKSTQRSHTVFSKLDPRVSEYILQFPDLAQAAERVATMKTSELKQPFHVFLPGLLECPLRTTGWEASTATRQLAYGLVNLVVSDGIQIVMEHRRQETKWGGRTLQLPTIAEAVEACSSLSVMYSSLHENLPHLSNNQVWTAVAVSQELEWSQCHEKSTLTGLAVKFLTTAKDIDKSKLMYNWDIIQFFSQIQASLYSLRILQQVASVVMSYEKTVQIPDSVRTLFQQLQYLPKFLEYQDRGNIGLFLDELSSIMTVSKIVMGIEDKVENSNQERGSIGPKETNQSKKRTKKERRQNSLPVSKRQKPNNMFELLDVDSIG